MCNEHEELKELLQFREMNRNEDDEIVILCDEGNTTQEVHDVIKSFEISPYYVNENPLNRDFAQQKNYLSSKCIGDWIFFRATVLGAKYHGSILRIFPAAGVHGDRLL